MTSNSAKALLSNFDVQQAELLPSLTQVLKHLRPSKTLVSRCERFENKRGETPYRWGNEVDSRKTKRSKGNQYLGHHDDMCGLYCQIKSYELLPKTSWQKQQTSSNMGRAPEQRYPWKTSGLMSRHPQAPNQQFNGLLFLVSLLNKQKQIHDSDAVLVAPAASPPNKMHHITSYSPCSWAL